MRAWTSRRSARAWAARRERRASSGRGRCFGWRWSLDPAMPLDADHDLPEDWQVEAILAYDEALAAGRTPSLRHEPDSQLQAVHDCQALLERVWPRSPADSRELPRKFGRFQLERELGRGGFG